MKGNLPEANVLLDMAIEVYERGDNSNSLALAFVRRAHTLRLLGKYADAMNDIEAALQIVETDSSLQPLYAEALRIRGLTSLRLGQSRSAVDDLEKSLSIYTELKETGSIPMLLAETAMIRATIGDVESAKDLYQESLVWLRAERNLHTQANTLNNLAVLYLQLGEYELASDTFEEGLECARKSRNHHAESLVLAGLGDLYAEIEEFEAATQAYERAGVAAGDDSGSFLSNYLILARANLAILQNDMNSASQFLGQFKRKLKVNASVYERGFWSFLEGRRNLLANDHKKAIYLLREGKACFFQDGRESEYQWCVIWLMVAYDQAGEREKALLEFQELLAGKSKISHSFIIALHQATPWLASLQRDKGIEKGLGGLIDKSRKVSAKMSSVRRVLRRLAQSIQMPTASLKIRALGRAEVSFNGRAVNVSDWRSQSARDLFFFFLNKREAMTKEQIGQELWHEIEDIQILKTRFKQDIYRLRKAVGRGAIVFEDEYYSFNRDMDYEYDVEAFESYLYRARQVDDKMERIGYYRKAIILYEGQYLSDVDDDWVLVERERLKVIYTSALENLAQEYLDTNQLLECLDTCNLAIAQNRYNETIYQLEMRAYAAQGDRASVSRRYKEYKTILADDLGLAPSEETESVYRELTV
jgi:two-component SAPR family response regulator/Tfp pilus assembly protein PilF